MACNSHFSKTISLALSFASTAFDSFTDTLYTFSTYCVNALFGLWREVSARVRNVLTRFSPQVLAAPAVSIVRAAAHRSSIQRRTLGRQHERYLRMCV